jgi:ribosome biogenesis protein NSA1
MASLENVDIWIGTALGPLKGASFKLLSDVSYQLPIQDGSSKLERSNEIKVMCWDHESEENLFLGHKNGRMSCFSTVSGEYVAGCCIRGIKEPGVPVGLEKHKKTLITCLDTGALSFWPEDEDKLEVSVGNHVSCMRGNPHVALQVATGGQENDLKVWDGQNSDKPVFQAKNVCPDNLQLRVPVWVTQLCFVPPVHSSSLVAVGTGHHHVRLYDIRAQKRPVYSTEFGDSPITAMDVVPNGRDVIIGNSKGQLAKVDLRTGKVVNTFKDGKGCIKCVKCHLEDPLLVSCGLDRFLRVYHLESRELLQRVSRSLQERLCTVCVCVCVPCVLCVYCAVCVPPLDVLLYGLVINTVV